MLTRSHEDYLITAVGKQVQMLKDVMYEIETDHLSGEALSWRLQAVEEQLQRLRDVTVSARETNAA